MKRNEKLKQLVEGVQFIIITTSIIIDILFVAKQKTKKSILNKPTHE